MDVTVNDVIKRACSNECCENHMMLQVDEIVAGKDVGDDNEDGNAGKAVDDDKGAVGDDADNDNGEVDAAAGAGGHEDNVEDATQVDDIAPTPPSPSSPLLDPDDAEVPSPVKQKALKKLQRKLLMQ
jgi:hypothetical protein